LLCDPEPLERQIYYLTPLWQFRWVSTQVLLTVLTAFDRVNEYLIGKLHLSQVVPTMTLLPTRFLPTLLP